MRNNYPKAVRVDDRTPSERTLTHTELWGGLDTFMSGWGSAPGKSYAFWACRPEDSDKVKRWVEKRGDIKHVRPNLPHLSRGDHLHIYAVDPQHPSVR